jgi:hypothetical protein
MISECNTDLLLLFDVSSKQGTPLIPIFENREKLKSIFEDFIKMSLDEKNFKFEKVTLRYYTNNSLIFHSRVYGDERDFEARIKSQSEACEIVIIAMKKALDKIDLIGKVKKALWALYKEINFDSDLKSSSLDVTYHNKICFTSTDDLCFNVLSVRNRNLILLVTDKNRIIAGEALSALSFHILLGFMKNNSINEMDSDLFKLQIPEHIPMLKIGAAKSISDRIFTPMARTALYVIFSIVFITFLANVIFGRPSWLSTLSSGGVLISIGIVLFSVEDLRRNYSIY